MGYIARSVAIPSVIKAIWDGSVPLYIGRMDTLGTSTYDTMFNQNINLTGCNELKVHWFGDVGLTVKCSIDGVQKFETLTGGAATQEQETIDTSANTGEVPVKIEIKDAGAVEKCQYFTMWRSD